VQPEAVGRKRIHRRGTEVAVQQEVLPRELSLPGVGQQALVRWHLVAPGEHGAFEAAARRALPLSLGRQ
jgi:hypothetical protein